jgi:hypothetical protein
MKLSAITIAIILAGAAGATFAAGQGKVMPQVNVRAASLSACMPPNDTTGHACDSYNEFLRANFPRREIGMLFGYQTSYPESLTGGIDRLHDRYDKLLQQYITAHSTVAAGADVASK